MIYRTENIYGKINNSTNKLWLKMEQIKYPCIHLLCTRSIKPSDIRGNSEGIFFPNTNLEIYNKIRVYNREIIVCILVIIFGFVY